MTPEAAEQYARALKAGQRYYRSAVNAGTYPYPMVLDEILDEAAVAGREEIGLVDIPSELIAGTKSAGRAAALAGNFMPLLDAKSEFASKWMLLCDAHLSDEGIRDPIECFEYMGRFYIAEGNKRASVLMSYGAPSVPGHVTRLVPKRTDDPEVQAYYEFMRFFTLAGVYGVTFRQPGGYAKMLAALGMDAEHVWTDEERRGFTAGFRKFSDAFEKTNAERLDVTPAEALLVWLELYSFADIKEQPPAELKKNLTALLPDIKAQNTEQIEVRTEPDGKEKGLVSKLLGIGSAGHLNIAFIYAFDPKKSDWTLAHDRGREYLEETLGERASVQAYYALEGDYLGAITAAADEGAKLIFATTPPMIDACRKIVAQRGDVKALICALSLPYANVRMYYSRIYEAKFVAGAIAGAVAGGHDVGYISNYPIVGVPTSINAFALGVRLTNPNARVKLRWTCVKGKPVAELRRAGVTVISNRDAADPQHPHWAPEWGTYALRPDGTMATLAVPCWDWGKMYVQIAESVLNGTWADAADGRAVNYWWGFDSGAIDLQLGDALPDGVYSLARLLKDGLASRAIDPFRTRIVDQSGTVRNEGGRVLSPEERIGMDWLCENVDGSIPAYAELMPRSRELVRLLGIDREALPPERPGEQA